MFEQLPSEYLKQNGEYKARYHFKIDKMSRYKFSSSDLDWINVIGEPLLPIHETPVATLEVTSDGKQVSWIDDAPYSNNRKAFNYSQEQMKFLFEDVIY